MTRHVTRMRDWLGLGAAPTFAIMALLTGVLGGGQMAMMCSTAPGGSPLGGMAAMYLLMSTFHLTPWLKLIARRRSAAFRPLRDPAETLLSDAAV
jgi:hypothetical protein